MFPKVIKTDVEYEAALSRIEELLDADPGTPEGDELELLATLVELYEKAAHPIDLPDPVEAVKFRMEQAELKQKDLVPFIGSRSKVSEVLSGQRPLSLPMIRKLHQGLGIPAEVLLQEPGAGIPEALEGVELERFPLTEMLKRGWFSGFEGTLAAARKQVEDLLTTWAAPLGQGALQPVLLRQHVRSGSDADPYAIAAWRIRITLLALEQELPAYRPGTVSQDFVRDLLRLSYLDNGPLLAREYLHKSGIHFVTEPHLSHTHLDGAALKMPDGSPLVALTLRHDRLDNFWFTLCHELAHIALHFDGEECEVFFDDLDQAELNAFERDADRWASEALIPAGHWQAAGMGRNPSADKIAAFAASLRINPAIPAGRIRKEKGDYKLFSKLVGYRQVRKQFAA